MELHSCIKYVNHEKRLIDLFSVFQLPIFYTLKQVFFLFFKGLVSDCCEIIKR